ncbi:hypothetical protein RHMOL_Rhmol12G0177300 [Rhododendron molle]|uniref:Uncharacterized protein n=1 Tax=Rhododendron molle TaxID=49168 RepID=A0ACC0LJQ7_RHOML|nr:hypothetical protein RHMOL_Rhmol12G0177300 [Rhododendron molle]
MGVGFLGGGFGLGALGLAAAAADGDVAEYAALGPVAAAGLAEVAGLGEVVVVVVAELGVERVASRALQRLVVREEVGPQTTVYSASAAAAEEPAAAPSYRMYILHLKFYDQSNRKAWNQNHNTESLRRPAARISREIYFSGRSSHLVTEGF